MLACGPFEAAAATLASLLDVQESEPLQLAAVAALAGYGEPRVGELLLERWRSYTPAVRTEVVEALLARPSRIRQYLEAARRGDASVALVDATRRELLRQSDDEATRKLADELFGKQALGERAAVVDAYQPALQLTGQPAAGEPLFQRHCMACHRLGDKGHPIGPDLASSPSRDPQALLTHVLDPNRYLLPNYQTYVVSDTDGRTWTGMIAAQTATSVTLKREEGKTTTLLRANIDQLSATGKSLMPEGFEKSLDRQQMADLLAYLQASRTASSESQPLDIGTLPGLVEPEPR